MPNVIRRAMPSTALLVVLTLVAVLAAVMNVARAQEYPVREGDLDTSSGATVAAGEDVTVTGSGFAGGAEVVITIESDPITLGATTADATGAISTSVVIPTTLTNGSHTLKATGMAAGGGLLVLAQAVEVIGGVDPGDDADATDRRVGDVGDVEETTAGGSLAATGLGVVGLAVVGLALLAGGGGAVALARRHRS